MITATKTPMTATGAEQLRKELEQLKKVERPEIIQAIAEARAHGDLRENAEYHAAKERQGFIEGRIRDIESKLSHAQVVDLSNITNNGTVIFASTVKIINSETQEEIAYQIVGEDEANIKVGKISITSPIARALIGKHVGDEVKVQTPSGVVEYEITEVDYI
jgi:transcription elongation factor GreA